MRPELFRLASRSAEDKDDSMGRSVYVVDKNVFISLNDSLHTLTEKHFIVRRFCGKKFLHSAGDQKHAFGKQKKFLS